MDDHTKEIVSKISRERWNRYHNELAIYAEARCNRWTWETGSKENLPKGFAAQSIATEAIQRFFQGERNWNHEIYPGENPIPFLKSVVRSIVSDIGRSKAHKTSASLEAETLKSDSDGQDYETEIQSATIISGFNPQREPTAYEKIFFNQIHQRILFVLQDSKDLVEFYRLSRDGLKLPAIRERMRKTKKEIEALRKKFARRTKKIREELFQEIEQINRIPEGGARVSTLNKR